MPINFHPKSGMILICNFNTGFQPPEMVKTRRVLVISPKKYNALLCRIVPLSTTPPRVIMPYHHEIPAGRYSFLTSSASTWVKGDMVTTVSLSRLDRLFLKGKFLSPLVDGEDYRLAVSAVIASFIKDLTFGET